MRDGASSFQAPGQPCPAYCISLLFLASAGAQPQKEVLSRWPAQEAVSSGYVATSRPQHPGALAETSHFCSSLDSEQPAFQLCWPPLAGAEPTQQVFCGPRVPLDGWEPHGGLGQGQELWLELPGVRPQALHC